ncbi:MAG: FtsQ-type POTRA domain-containing protein [Akkermansia sp.]|nr:FtsQ-type POTRA domain-containing protein [Akkermansia sp.]
MAKRNQYRTHYGEGHSASANVRLLEAALSLKHRFFSIVALRRGLRRLRKWVLILLIVIPLVAGLIWGGMRAVEKAYSLSIDKVTFDARQKLISKEQALQILGIEGSINMATLDTGELKQKLEANHCIESADIRAELPDTLHIEINERIPVVYVEQESGADTGNRIRFFMDPKGHLFPVMPEYHRNFMGVPIWYLQPGDVSEFAAGTVVDEAKRRPIVELVAAANLYSLVEIPAIREIFRPKDWKIIATLDGGAEVLMQVYDIKGQMERLAMILEHCRATQRRPRSINVIPRINPTVNYAEPPAAGK